MASFSTISAVFSWGWGTEGQLGHGEKKNHDSPRLLSALTNTKVVSVAMGYRHSMCVDEQGRLFSWGNGTFGRLGQGREQGEDQPKRVAKFLVPSAHARSRLMNAAVLERGSATTPVSIHPFSEKEDSVGRTRISGLLPPPEDWITVPVRYGSES